MKGFGDLYKSEKKKNKKNEFSNEQIINQAIQLHLKGNISEAAKYYQKLISQGCNDHRVFSNYGVILQGQGKFQDAELSYRKAIELKPDYADAHNNLGVMLVNLGKFHDAELSYRKAIKLKPDYAEAHCNLGNILSDLGKLHDAELSTRKALEIKPDYPVAHNNLGITLANLGKLYDAEISTREAIKLKPNYAEAYCNLGFILCDLGKLYDAELSTRKALEIKPDYAVAHCNLGQILSDLGKLHDAELSTRKALEIKPDYADAAWNLYGLANSMKEAEEWLIRCLKIDENYLKAKLNLSALKFHQGDKSLFDNLIKSTHKDHPITRSIKWVSTLPKLPKLFFHRWALFDTITKKSKKDRPFYEFGVWRGESFKYLINTLKKGYGFDTFEGLPEDWHQEKQGSYSADGTIPKIDGGIFIAGKYENTLPTFFAKSRPLASLINFDADLYSSTLCALNYSKPVIDEDTILIFDEFIINDNWEEDEFKALNEFCSNNNLCYEVLAVSYFTKQVALKLIGI